VPCSRALLGLRKLAIKRAEELAGRRLVNVPKGQYRGARAREHERAGKPSSSCPPFFTSCRPVEHALSVTNRGANLERTSC
jgi:hypothetical protein